VGKWKVYNEINQLLEQRFSKSKIAKKLGISRGTVLNYCNKDPEEMALWLASTKHRRCILDAYQEEILSWLREHADLSSAQVFDWLEERYPDMKVGESTVRRYVRVLREEHRISKQTVQRVYEAVPELAMGFQIQVDFGETWQRNPEGQLVKLYVAAFVLSHSRYKYKEWLDRPFTTRDLIYIHENAFRFFGGKPKEMVYDQDSLIVVSENHGDIIYTKEFEAYRRKEGFRVHVCRGGDPESKGKIENVIQFIKKSFAKHRVYTTLDDWNEQGHLWLSRRGNGKIHNTTKKRPAEVFQEEKHHLQPVRELISVTAGDKPINKPNLSIPRVVRKDNTILYKANRYSVPLGTYSAFGKEVTVHIKEGIIRIVDPETGEMIGTHRLHAEKGKLIQETNHTRDRSKGIQAYMETTAAQFANEKLARMYLEKVKERFPRYMRDQLQLINKQWKEQSTERINQALEECQKRRLYSAPEFQDMIIYLNGQNAGKETKKPNQKEIQVLHPNSSSILIAKPAVRDVAAYIEILEGGSL
jgi:transposase